MEPKKLGREDFTVLDEYKNDDDLASATSSNSLDNEEDKPDDNGSTKQVPLHLPKKIAAIKHIPHQSHLHTQHPSNNPTQRTRPTRQMALQPLKNIIIVGAGGQIGSQIVTQLLLQGKHHVSALTRPDSNATMPSTLHSIRKANYDNEAQLTAALADQDVLIITMGVTAPPESSLKLIDAAAKAGVKYIVPNEWSNDRAQVQLGNDIMMAPGQIKVREYIEAKGLKWIGIGCGFWYEYSLGGGEGRFGFDFEKREVTWFDGGDVKITTTTWPQTGRALAKVLALPREGGDGGSIRMFENGQVLVGSFFVSQRDMFDSVLRVTGGKENDWKFSREGAKERFARGQGLMQKGDFSGFTVAMYSRAFFQDDAMNHEAKKVNEMLGLPQEDLDAATKVAMEMAASGVKY